MGSIVPMDRVSLIDDAVKKSFDRGWSMNRYQIAVAQQAGEAGLQPRQSWLAYTDA